MTASTVRPRKVRRIAPGVLVLALLTGACSESAPAPESRPLDEGGRSGGQSRLVVYTVNEPLRYFAERIGGAAARVELPAPTGADPAFWSPSADEIGAYQKADLILLNGAGYARWVPRAPLPPSRMVDTSAVFRDRYLAVENTAVHMHGPQGEHSHGEIAFTTWLDPTLAIEQTRAVAAALIKLRPEMEAQFRSRAAALEADLSALDERLARVAVTIGDEPLLFSHPVYQYLQRRYGLNGHSLHWEPDAPPDERQWSALEETLAPHPARWMIWEGKPHRETAARLQAMGVGSVVFDPCASIPAAGDFLEVMTGNVERLEKIFPTQLKTWSDVKSACEYWAVNLRKMLVREGVRRKTDAAPASR